MCLKGRDPFGWQKSQLKLCLMMQRGVNFLILDEPTNHLDMASREWMEEVIEDFEDHSICVSHRYFVRSLHQQSVSWRIKSFTILMAYEEYRNWKR